MAVRKSELYSTLWKSCDELRGGMDASQYKDYVLVLLFVKYVSDKYKNDDDALIEIPKGASFEDMILLKGKDDIGEGINKILKAIAEANDLSGVVDAADFDDDSKLGSGKEKKEKLSNLVGLFQSSGLDFSKNKSYGDDILGDAYEYFMKNFATESGKSKGQFYTPAEVSRVMAKLIGLNNSNSLKDTIYDPTCGSGSLLIRANSETQCGATIFGQEKDVTTAALAKMNMIVHQMPEALIEDGNTLAQPKFRQDGRLMTFDFVVANPPFSDKSWTNGTQSDDEDGRWNKQIGIPPDKNGDYAYLLHIIKSLKETGKGACILPHGVLFRGNAEAEIRKKLIKSGVIKGIIGLPANLFFGTGIPACIIVMDKEHAKTRKHIFMIDAKECYVKDGAKNRLREEDILRIVDTFIAGKDVPYFARKVELPEIEKHNYNLNIPRYIPSANNIDVQDIEAHLKGGIPNKDIDALHIYWEQMTSLKDALIKPHDREGYSELKISKQEIKSIIETHPDFITQKNKVEALFATWKSKHINELKSLDTNINPTTIIDPLGISLTNIFADDELLDMYDVYEQLMVYWIEVMQDDCYQIADDGWAVKLTTPQPEAKKKKGETEAKKKKTKVASSIDDLACDLLPPQIVAVKYFSEQLEQISKAEDSLNKVTAERDEYIDAHSDILSDDYLEKLNRANAMKQLKSNQKACDAEEVEILTRYIAFEDLITKTKKTLSELNLKLVKSLEEKYNSLTEQEVKDMVVEDKWFCTIEEGVFNEFQKVIQYLITRLITLAERYEFTLFDIDKEVEKYEKKVAEHLNQMGFTL